MRIGKARRHFGTSAKRLRRARRLYGHLCSATIIANPEAAIPIAYRAKAAGLYSEITSISDVIFSLCRHACRVRKTPHEWWAWANSAGHVPWRSHSMFYRMDGGKIQVKKKPRIRVINQRAAA